MPGFDVYKGDGETPSWLPEDLVGANVVRTSQSFLEGWRKCPSMAVAEAQPTFGDRAAKGIIAHALVSNRIDLQGTFEELDKTAIGAACEELTAAGFIPDDIDELFSTARLYGDILTDLYLAKYHRYSPNLKAEQSGMLRWDTSHMPGDVDAIVMTGTADLIVTPGSHRFGVDWKGLALDTPIPTPEGFVPMGCLKVGDMVFDMHGTPTRVIGVSEIKNLDCYEVRFRNGETITCDAEHLWTLSDGSVVGVRDLARGDLIPVAAPLEERYTVPPPMDPWVLGFWLGDGNRSRGEVTKAEDSRCWQEFERLGYELGKIQRDPRSQRSVTRAIKGLAVPLRGCGQLKNKHIPTDILRWSVEDRQRFVQGFCDSDGSWNPQRGQAVWSQVDTEIADGFFAVLCSLGEKPYRWSHDASGFGLTVREYRVVWTPRVFNPFACEKGDPLTLKATKQNVVHEVASVTSVPSVPTVCIKVDSPTSTFLCGEAMIPTHNTGSQMPQPWQVQRYGIQWRAYAAMFELDEMFFEYPIAHNPPDGTKPNWVAARYNGVVHCKTNAAEREAFKAQLLTETMPVANLLLASTDPADHAATPTDWWCGSWCQRFVRFECVGGHTEIEWVATAHEKAGREIPVRAEQAEPVKRITPGGYPFNDEPF